MYLKCEMLKMLVPNLSCDSPPLLVLLVLLDLTGEAFDLCAFSWRCFISASEPIKAECLLCAAAWSVKDRVSV